MQADEGQAPSSKCDESGVTFFNNTNFKSKIKESLLHTFSKAIKFH